MILCLVSVYAHQSSAIGLDNLVVSNVNNGYNSYMLTYTDKDFKSVNISETEFGKKAFIGNVIAVAAGKLANCV